MIVINLRLQNYVKTKFLFDNNLNIADSNIKYKKITHLISFKPDPVTLDTQNIGTVFFLRLLEAAVIQSSSDFTTNGILLEPAA